MLQHIRVGSAYTTTTIKSTIWVYSYILLSIYYNKKNCIIALITDINLRIKLKTLLPESMYSLFNYEMWCSRP
jgi:hypothetical protein